MNLALLKSLSQINSGICLEAGKPIVTFAPSESILAICKETSDVDFNIYDIKSFISVASLTSDAREMDVYDNVMTIKDGKSKFIFHGGIKSAIFTPPDDLTPLTDLEYTNEFEISAAEFTQLMTAADLFKSENVIFRSKGGKVVISTESDFDDSNSYTVEIDDVKNPQTLTAKLARDTMKIIPDQYTISISDTAVKFENDTITYYVVIHED